MSIKLIVEPENKLLYVQYLGDVDLDQLCKDVLSLTTNPNYKPDWDGISDFSGARILYTKEDMFQFQKFVEKLPNASTGRWAVIMPDTKSYKTTVIWEILSDGIHDSMYVCHSKNEAYNWLKLKQ